MTILLHRYRVFNHYGKLGRYCTFCRGGIFEKRESELSSRFRASTVPHRRYRLEPVFRTKLCKTGTQQVPSRVPRYYYILVSKGSGIGVLTKSHTSYTVTIICDRSKSVAIRPKCGFLRITGLYRINNKTCGLLHHQDSLESSESTAKLGVNTLIKIIYNMHIHLV